MPFGLKTLRHAAEAAAVRSLGCVIPVLPRWLVLAFSAGCGTLAYWFLRDLRRVAEVNHAIAFPDATARERRRTVRAAFRSFALVGIDLFWTRRLNANNVRRHVRFVNEELARAVLDRGRGAVAVTLHLGDWEILAPASALVGVPIHAVARPLINPLLTDWFDRHRRRCGVRLVHRSGAVRASLRALAAGEVVALLIDQNTKPEEGGMFVDFFGLPATITRAPAVLALRTGAPLVLATGVPTDDGGWEVRYGPEIPASTHPDPETAVGETTRRCAKAIEDAIRADPDRWLWMYKRWKYRPSPDAPGYPAYATKVLQE